MNHVMRRVSGLSLLLVGGLTCSAGAQMRPADAAAAPGIIPTGFGESVDRDVARVRAATAPFKVAEKAIAAGYPRHTDCVENQPQGAMGFHFQNNTPCSTRRSTSNGRRCWSTSGCRTARSN